MKEKWVNVYLEVAKVFANVSYAKRLKVGAVIVKDNRILSTGFNGTPAGWDNSCEDENDKTKSEVIHAEENSILKLARDGESGKDATMILTHSPCINCSRMIYSTGIKEVYYKDEYRSNDGIEFLNKCGIKVTKIED
jgi:dCMP deaminase